MLLTSKFNQKNIYFIPYIVIYFQENKKQKNLIFEELFLFLILFFHYYFAQRPHHGVHRLVPGGGEPKVHRVSPLAGHAARRAPIGQGGQRVAPEAGGPQHLRNQLPDGPNPGAPTPLRSSAAAQAAEIRKNKTKKKQ
jgi:hypothetical protein